MRFIVVALHAGPCLRYFLFVEQSLYGLKRALHAAPLHLLNALLESLQRFLLAVLIEQYFSRCERYLRIYGSCEEFCG